jgi:hypothetical protein
MELFVIAALVLAFNFPHFYGAAENRLFKEHGEYLPGQHFRVYHLWLALLFAGSGFLVYVISVFALLNSRHVVYSPLGLDWVWWLIRFYDFKLDSVKARYSYQEENAWHIRIDWDNYLGLPLVFGCYWWWFVFGALSAVLGGLSLLA